MISDTIPLLYTPEHQLHYPKGEFEQGEIIEYREKPERIESIYRHLITRGLGRLVTSAGTASIDSLFQVHSLQMLDFIEAVSNSIQTVDSYLYADFFPIRPASMTTRPKTLAGRLGYYSTDPYSPIGKGTWRAALSAAGLAMQAAGILLRHEANCVYALSRPPGHHAGPDFFGSYCYINNAALAASHLLAMGRVAVLDIDYHHGNGTQAIFWDDPRVLYASLHMDPNLDFPYFSGYKHETGGIQAPGSTFNIPLPPNTTTASYLQALIALLSTIKAFHPAALVVSLGFDAYQGDPLSEFRLEAGAYSAIGASIAGLGLPTLLVQEGGYSGEALPGLAENFLTGFLGNLHSRTPPGV
jgi:acetoin utilization deacetylase AcuC-like enzyme